MKLSNKSGKIRNLYKKLDVSALIVLQKIKHLSIWIYSYHFTKNEIGKKIKKIFDSNLKSYWLIFTRLLL
jgi:TATA-binding protein-associated factor Taf7